MTSQNNAPMKFITLKISLGRNQFLRMIILNYLLSLARGNSDWLFLAKIKDIGPHICEHLPMGSTQSSICEEYPKMIRSVSDGAVRGILECQHQFQNDKWNCSTQSVFGKLLNRGTKEVAFINAITSAGVMYSVTKACSRGEYINCSCDDNYTTAEDKDKNGNFRWGGCSDDSQFGGEFVEKFVDTSETSGQDPRSKMNLYNNMVGRKALKKSTRTRCKCHGPTASCNLRTCWKELGDFRATGDYLKNRYYQAVQVEVRQDNGGMKPVEAEYELSKNDLVYLDQSPDYCFHNSETGSIGTAGRKCNTSSSGADNCDSLCCGRKYHKRDVVLREKCNCKFQWCCEVKCQECVRYVTVHTCANGDIMDENIIKELSSSPKKPRKRKRKRGRNGNKQKKGGKKRRNKGKRKSKQRRSIEDKVYNNHDYFKWLSDKLLNVLRIKQDTGTS